MRMPSLIPSAGLQIGTIPFLDTTGGMNQSPFLGEIAANQAEELRNLVLDRGNGAWRNRQGSALYRTADSLGGDFRAMLDFKYWPGGATPTRQFLAVAGDRWVRDDGTGWTAIQTIADVENTALLRFRDQALLADGTNFLKWDGSAAADVGGTHPNADRLAVWKERLWANDVDNRTRLHYTLPGYSSVWMDDTPPSGIPNDAGYLEIDWVDALSAVYPWYDFLAVFGYGNVYLLSGSSPNPTSDDPFKFIRVATHRGTASPGSIVTTPGPDGERLFFQGTDKHFYEVSLRQGVTDGALAVRISDPIKPLIDTISETKYTVTQGVYSSELNAILWACQRTGTAGDMILVFDVGYNAWTYWDGITVRALAAIEDSNGREQLYGGDASGQARHLNTGNDDAGTAISKRIRTRVYRLSESGGMGRVVSITPSLFQQVNSAMSWSYILDSAIRVDRGAITFYGMNLPYWGSAHWGAALWSKTPVLEQSLHVGKTCRHVQFQFLNEASGAGNDFALSGLTLAVQPLAVR